MRKSQIIAILVAVAAIAGLYFVLDMKPRPKTAKSPAAGGAGPMMGPPADFDSVLAVAKMKVSPALNQQIMEIENSVKRGNVTEQQIIADQELSKLWQKNGNMGLAAHYWGEAAKLENSEKSLNFAGQLYRQAADEEQMPRVKKLWGTEAYAVWQQVLTLNPGNDSAKVSLALSMIDRGDMMNGVLKLKDYADNSPKDVRAQMLMANFAMQTNQFDKVVDRCKRIIAVDPQNIPARELMAEAYASEGKVPEAREVLNEAKRIVHNPQYSQQIDKFLEQFKN